MTFATSILLTSILNRSLLVLRTNVSLIVCVAITISASSVSVAQFEVPRGAVVPVPADEPLSPSAQSKIAESLGNENQSQNQQPTGDPILDDVLEIIRRRGSVLRGSALEDTNQIPKISIITTDEPLRSISGGEVSPSISVYLAAEQLLRASRTLERLGGPSGDRSELIRAMRSHAAKLLIDAISQEMPSQFP